MEFSLFRLSGESLEMELKFTNGSRHSNAGISPDSRLNLPSHKPIERLEALFGSALLEAFRFGESGTKKKWLGLINIELMVNDTYLYGRFGRDRIEIIVDFDQNRDY